MNLKAPDEPQDGGHDVDPVGHVNAISYSDLLAALVIAWETLERMAEGAVADVPAESMAVIKAIRRTLGVDHARNVEAVEVFYPGSSKTE